MVAVQIVKVIWRYFLRQFYKLQIIDGPLYCHYVRGKFRVQYPDGKISQKFAWKTAKDYRDIFGGKIINAF